MPIDEIRKLKSETDWKKLDSQGDYGGPQEFDVDWSKSRMVYAQPKKMVSLRLDADLIEFFKAGGKGYQTRINAVLRTYKKAMESKPD